MKTINLREVPVFPNLERAAIAYAFEITDSTSPRTAFRISEVHRALFSDQSAHGPAARDLFVAAQSFLDDITTGIPGTNGRPLMFAGSTEAATAEQRKVSLQRPSSWAYIYENTEVLLHSDGASVPLILHDLFCAFESGRLFYMLILTHSPENESWLNEYDIIRLQQCCIDKQFSSIEKINCFFMQGKTCSLVDIANNRLNYLDSLGSKAVNGIAHVLREFGLISARQSQFELTSDSLINGMIFIEDSRVFNAGQHALQHYAKGRGSSAHPEWLLADNKSWQANASVICADAQPAHDFLTSIDAAPRALLAIAGMAQGVPDFPRQDDSEIHDSTRPAYAALESLFYVHPAFQLEVGKNWRSFRESQDSIGACPYALLAWVIAFHDEQVVAGMEQMIEQMIFGPVKPNTQPSEIGRANPLGNLTKLLKRVGRISARREGILESNLALRLDIFRWCSIFQAGNVFRYPTERELLNSIRDARGTRQRFDDAHQLLDRYEALAEDLTDLAASYSAARTNWLLTSLAMISLFTLPKALQDVASLFDNQRSFIGSALCLVLLALSIYLVGGRRGRS
jgi:hypothetical protein